MKLKMWILGAAILVLSGVASVGWMSVATGNDICMLSSNTSTVGQSDYPPRLSDRVATLGRFGPADVGRRAYFGEDSRTVPIKIQTIL